MYFKNVKKFEGKLFFLRTIFSILRIVIVFKTLNSNICVLKYYTQEQKFLKTLLLLYGAEYSNEFNS